MEPVVLVVETGETGSDALERIVKIHKHFRERQYELEHRCVVVDGIGRVRDAAPVHA